MSSVTITSEPANALIDEIITIRLHNLKPGQNITVHNLTNNDGKKFGAYAHYVADGNGEVDVSRDGSVGGSYKGVLAMGLFSHLYQLPGQRKGLRLIQKQVHQPIRSEITLHGGHLSSTELYEQDGPPGLVNSVRLLSECHEIHRFYISEDVTWLDVRVGNIRGVLFLPKGPGPFPGVIDMFGTVGGLVQFRSALLASHGYASLALAYFNYEDLPATFDVDLAYFEEAAQWLSTHESIMPGGVAALGVSRGAEMAADMFAHFSQYVRAAICINGSYFYWMCSYKGKLLGNPMYTQSITAPRIIDGALSFMPEKQLADALGEDHDLELESSTIPVEHGSGSIMFIVGSADTCCPALQMAQMMVRRLQRHRPTGISHQLVTYPGAGHLIEPPYAPLCALAYHPPFDALMWFGGETDAHAKAQEDSWQRILDFLRQNLLAPRSARLASKL